MRKKIQVTALFLTFIGTAVSVFSWRFPVSPKQEYPVPKVESRSPEAEKIAVLAVSGTGAKVKIRKGLQGGRYAGGRIVATGSESTVYLPAGQQLILNISGTGAQVSVASELMPYIQLNNNAVGANVSEI